MCEAEQRTLSDDVFRCLTKRGTILCGGPADTRQGEPSPIDTDHRLGAEGRTEGLSLLRCETCVEHIFEWHF